MFLEKRIKEAAKMGFTTLYIPDTEKALTDFLSTNDTMKLVTVKNISDFTKYIS